MARYRSTKPYWIKAKYAGECSRCKKTINRNEDALYFSSTRTMLCSGEDCGKQHDRDMAADDFDQAQYQSQY
jgi:hypothetical protein